MVSALLFGNVGPYAKLTYVVEISVGVQKAFTKWDPVWKHHRMRGGCACFQYELLPFPVNPADIDRPGVRCISKHYNLLMQNLFKLSDSSVFLIVWKGFFHN
jgi:hypothetical protein